jgi:hypothetical protein
MIKIKFNKETKEEEYAPLFLKYDEVICLYKDRRGVFIVTDQGFMHKVPYKLESLTEALGL